MAAQCILIVDDNQTNRDLLRQLLEPLGFDLFEADDGQTALDQLEHIAPALVLMDIGMPVMDGLTATRLMRQTPGFEDLVVVIITAFNREEYEQRAIDAGCTAFLTKPINLDALYALIESYLTGK